MKSLIIYDSQFGNTEKIARAIGQALGSDAKIMRISEAAEEDLKNIELVIAGSPTQGGRPTPAFKKFFSEIPASALKNIRAAAFDTGIPAQGQKVFLRFVINFFGYASKRLAAALEAKGANVIGAETFFVQGREGPLQEGEIERAEKWGEQISQVK
ncbi:MAG: flavodoxin family protein [Patescibacteria group bacterium]|jgi:flavodoxin